MDTFSVHQVVLNLHVKMVLQVFRMLRAGNGYFWISYGRFLCCVRPLVRKKRRTRGRIYLVFNSKGYIYSVLHTAKLKAVVQINSVFCRLAKEREYDTRQALIFFYSWVQHLSEYKNSIFQIFRYAPMRFTIFSSGLYFIDHYYDIRSSHEN